MKNKANTIFHSTTPNLIILNQQTVNPSISLDTCGMVHVISNGINELTAHGDSSTAPQLTCKAYLSVLCLCAISGPSLSSR